MWFLDDLNGEDAEAQFISDIHKASTSSLHSSSVRGSPKVMLQGFLRDLNFWDISQGNGCNHKSVSPTILKRRQSSSSTTSSTSSKGASRSRNSSSYRRMQQRDRTSSRDSHDSVLQQQQQQQQQTLWKTATDPVTGRTYYYDAITRKTQWNKVCVITRKINRMQIKCNFFSNCLFILLNLSLNTASRD
jgi:hypothetical protein